VWDGGRRGRAHPHGCVSEIRRSTAPRAAPRSSIQLHTQLQSSIQSSIRSSMHTKLHTQLHTQLHAAAYAAPRSSTQLSHAQRCTFKMTPLQYASPIQPSPAPAAPPHHTHCGRCENGRRAAGPEGRGGVIDSLHWVPFINRKASPGKASQSGASPTPCLHACVDQWSEGGWESYMHYA
jgi:hypothetical protein